MEKELLVNGLSVEAYYPDRSVSEVFLPLLERWIRMYREKGTRLLVLLGAPPAMGKSTLLEFLSYLMKKEHPEIRLTVLGMDGFHYPNSYLSTHTTERDGKTVLLKEVKGSPETFDTEKLAAKLAELKAGGEVLFPFYDRTLHDPVADALSADGEIVLMEGNYLLLDDPRWEAVRKPADELVFIEAEAETLRERLVRRKALGIGRAAAEEFVDRSDMKNVHRCLSEHIEPDILLRVDEEENFTVVKKGN